MARRAPTSVEYESQPSARAPIGAFELSPAPPGTGATSVTVSVREPSVSTGEPPHPAPDQASESGGKKWRGEPGHAAKPTPPRSP